MEEQPNERYKYRSILVGIPKGTSHQQVHYFGIQLWPFAALISRLATVVSE